MLHLSGRLRVVLPLAFVAALIGAPAIAQAATTTIAVVAAIPAGDNCDTTVVDLTPSKIIGNAQQIQAEEAPFSAAGYMVRVRAFNSLTPSEIESYLTSMVGSCTSWQSLSGNHELADNMLVIVVTENHHDAVFFGGDLTGKLKPNKAKILSDMGVQFREGNFQGGIVVAMQDALKLMNNQSIGSGSGTSGGSSTAGKVFVYVILVIVGLFLVIVVIAIFVFLVRRVKKENQLTAEAKARAIQARTEAQSAVDGIATITDGVDATTVELLVPRLGEATAAKLNTAWYDAEAKAQAVYDARDALVKAGASQDPDKVHTRAEYGAIAKAWGKVKKSAEAAVQANQSVSTRCTELNEALKNAPATLESLRRTVADTRQQYQNAVSDGIHVAGGVYLEDATAALDQAASLIEQQYVGAALDQFETAKVACENVISQITTEQERRARIQRIASTAHSDVDSLGAELDRVEQAISGRRGQAGFEQRVSTARQRLAELRRQLAVPEPDYIAFDETRQRLVSVVSTIDQDSMRAHRRATAPRPTATYRSSSGMGSGFPAGLMMGDLLGRDDFGNGGGIGGDSNSGGGQDGGIGNW